MAIERWDLQIFFVIHVYCELYCLIISATYERKDEVVEAREDADQEGGEDEEEITVPLTVSVIVMASYLGMYGCQILPKPTTIH